MDIGLVRSKMIPKTKGEIAPALKPTNERRANAAPMYDSSMFSVSAVDKTGESPIVEKA